MLSTDPFPIISQRPLPPPTLADDILDTLPRSDEYRDLVGDDHLHFHEKGFCMEKDKYCMYSDSSDSDDEEDNRPSSPKKRAFWNKVFVPHYRVQRCVGERGLPRFLDYIIQERDVAKRRKLIQYASVEQIECLCQLARDLQKGFVYVSRYTMNKLDPLVLNVLGKKKSYLEHTKHHLNRFKGVRVKKAALMRLAAGKTSFWKGMKTLFYRATWDNLNVKTGHWCTITNLEPSNLRPPMLVSKRI